MTSHSLRCSCLLERWYGFSLESTLIESGFEDCMEELSFVNGDKIATEDLASSALPAAAQAWAAQHVHVWRQCANGTSPILIFQDDVTFASTEVYHTTAALVAAAQGGEYSGSFDDSRSVLIILDAAEPDAEASQLAAAAPNGSMLLLARSAAQVTSYVLWPQAARLLLNSLPLDVPVPAFLARHVAARTVEAVMVSPALVA